MHSAPPSSDAAPGGGPAPGRRGGVTAALAALEAAQRRFESESDRPEAEATVRRLARALVDGGALEDRPEQLAAADTVLQADTHALPAATAGLVSLLHRAIQAPGARNGGVILLVEDDLLFARTLEQGLSTHGRRVVVVNTAAGAREVLRQTPVDLVLLDLILPDDDGRALLVELRSHPRSSGVPVFVVSARLGSQTKAECFALGADAYFEKPVDLEAFAVAVSSRLERHATQAELARRDPVTGLPNRAAFLERLAHLRQSSPDDTRFALAVLDLDHFRWIEETWGRQFADGVLRRAGIRLAMVLRQAAVFARWDGAEFIALFAGRTAAEAAAIVDQARGVLRRVDFRATPEAPLVVSFSAGVVDLEAGQAIEECLAQADRLRYVAKASGRNRVVSGEASLAVPSRRVLLAEDDPAMRRLVTQHLRREGFEVVAYPDGEAALAALPASGASLVISDIQMPNLDGLAFLRALREHPDLQHVPVMMLTAVGDEAHIVRAFELGADDYLTKPASMRELVVRVRRLLRRPSLAGVPAA